MRAILMGIALLLAWSTFAYSQPPSPTPTKTGQKEQSNAGDAATDSNAPVEQTKQAPLSVTLDGPITIEKSQKDRDAAAAESEQKASRDWWLIVWTAILAITTIALVCITGLLARYTYKLWRDASNAGQRRASEMRESLRIAGVAADAATKAAEATEKQAATIVNLERPIVVVEGVELIARPIPEFIRQLSGTAPYHPVNESYDVYLSFTNYGRTPTEIRSISWNWTIAKSIPPEPIYANRVERGAGFEIVIKPGELRREMLRASVGFSINPEQRTLIDERKIYAWIWLRLLCADFFGGIADVGYACFHWPAVKSGGLEILPAQFVIAQSQPLYAYRKYYADGVIPEQPPATGLS